MKLDPNPFLSTLQKMKKFILNPDKKLSKAITETSVSSNVPIAAVILFVMRDDVHGSTPELREHLDVITKFYGYTEFVAWEDLNVSPERL